MFFSDDVERAGRGEVLEGGNSDMWGSSIRPYINTRIGNRSPPKMRLFDEKMLEYELDLVLEFLLVAPTIHPPNGVGRARRATACSTK